LYRQQPLGFVVGETSPHRFLFTIDADFIPPLLEYVYTYVEEEIDGVKKKVPVLAQIQQLTQKSPLLDASLSSEAARKAAKIGSTVKQVLALAQVLGYLKDGKVHFPRYPPAPGVEVYRATDDMLKRFFSVEEDEALFIGYLINRQSVEVSLRVSGLGRHLAILAATGAGKSHTAGVIIEELLKKGASILAIDPHGDYSEMRFTPDGKIHPFANRIVVISSNPRVSKARPYLIKTSNLDVDELCALAGIPERATNIRAAIREAIKALKAEGNDYDLNDIIEKLQKWSENPPAIIRRNKKFSEACQDALKYLEGIRRLKIFSKSTIPIEDLLRPGQLTVLNLSGTRFAAQDLIARDILTRVYEARVSYTVGESGGYPYPVFVVLEEAHRFIPPKEARSTYSSEIIKTIAAEGRKFGVYLIVISQRPSRIDPDVLSQCQSQIVLRVVNPRDQLTIQESSEAFSKELLENLPGLNVGEAVIVGPIVKTPVMVKVRPRMTMHGGADLPIVDLLKSAKKQVEELEHIQESEERGLSEAVKIRERLLEAR